MRGRALVGGALVALCALGLAAPASAGVVRPFEGVLGSAEEQAFADATGLAVDQSSGDVLVIDTGAETLSRFHPDGTPSPFSALGTHVIDGEGAGDGTPEGGLLFGGTEQVAVDGSGGPTDGDIYLTQSGRGLVYVFEADGSYAGSLGGFEGTPFGEPCGVAAGPDGDVYVGDDPAETIYKFDPAASPVGEADAVDAFGIERRVCTLAAGAGPSAGSLYFARFLGAVFEIDATSGAYECQGEFGAQAIDTASHNSVSVDPASGHLLTARAGGPAGGDAREWDASGAAAPGDCAEFVTEVDSARFFEGAGNGTEGVAAHGASGKLYTSIPDKVRVWGPLSPVPDVVTGTATEVGATTARLNGTVNPDGGAVTECFFEYGETTAYGEEVDCVPEASELGAGSAPVPVHAEIEGLEEETTYHFRLVAASANGQVEGEDETLATQSPPRIVDHWTDAVGFETATLVAEINPKNVASTYRFEWATEAEWEASETYGNSTGELDLGDDGSVHTVSHELEGLVPGQTYHWRVVAKSVLGETVGEDRELVTYRRPVPETDCPNQRFRGGASELLPDCRAHEMVSPPDKGGGDIVVKHTVEDSLEAAYRQAAAGGQRVTYTATTAFGDAQRGSIASQYLSDRGPGGWSTHALNPPKGTTVTDPAHSIRYDLHTNFLDFAEDLCAAALKDHNLVPLEPDAQVGFANLYRRENCGPGADSYETLTLGPEPSAALNELLERSGRHSSGTLAPDGSLTAFGVAAALHPSAVSGPDPAVGTNSQLYSREAASGELRVVSVLPAAEGGEASTESSFLGGGPGSNRGGVYERAISADGSRIYWNSAGRLYVRARDAGAYETHAVSAGAATFWGAATDGEAALFSEGTTLYEFDLASAQAGEEAVFELATGLGGVAGSSEDLSRVYFTSTEVLDDEEEGEAGKWNLYLLDGEAVSLVATLADADTEAPNSPHADAASPLLNPSRATPDGSHLAFMSTAPLTDYDNTDAASKEAASEVFVYDAAADEVSCASCRPSGARPRGRRLEQVYGKTASPDLWSAAWIPTREWANHSRRTISADGRRVFFNSYDALVPWDVNEAQDVYQWEAPGKGGCDPSDTSFYAANAGCLSLLSTGRSPIESELLDASANGDDVFFTTASSIEAPRDEGLIDVYDARVGGGLPQPPPPAECEGDACQAVPPAPEPQAPASAAFRGPGDPVARRDCGSAGRRAARLARRARRARRLARRIDSARGTRRMSRKARRFARRAKGLSNGAKRCRKARRGAAR